MALSRHDQIRFVLDNGLSCPVFICAVCGEPLKQPGKQMMAWDMEREDSGEYVLYPVHKPLDGRICLSVLERRIEDEDGGSMGTMELSDFIGHLLHNSGYEGAIRIDGDFFGLRRRCRENSA